MAWLRPSSRPPGVEMPQSDLRQTVRERLASGWLFPAPSQTWAGKGTGHVCIVCGITIQSSEVENEVVGPMTVWSHCRAIRSGAKNHRPTNWQRVRMGPTEGTEATTLPVSVRPCVSDSRIGGCSCCRTTSHGLSEGRATSAPCAASQSSPLSCRKKSSERRKLARISCATERGSLSQ